MHFKQKGVENKENHQVRDYCLCEHDLSLRILQTAMRNLKYFELLTKWVYANQICHARALISQSRY